MHGTLNCLENETLKIWPIPAGGQQVNVDTFIVNNTLRYDRNDGQQNAFPHNGGYIYGYVIIFGFKLTHIITLVIMS